MKEVVLVITKQYECNYLTITWPRALAALGSAVIVIFLTKSPAGQV